MVLEASKVVLFHLVPLGLGCVINHCLLPLYGQQGIEMQVLLCRRVDVHFYPRLALLDELTTIDSQNRKLPGL